MWAIGIIASLALLIVLMLCVPLDMVLRWDTEKKPKFSVRLAWLFGLVSTDVIRKKEIRHQQKERHPKTGEDLKTALYVLKTKGLLKRLVKLLKATFHHIKIKDIRSELKIALDNPADTGLLFSIAAPVNLLIRSYSSHQIVLQPSFDDDAFLKGYFYGAARVQPIQLVPPILVFTFSLPVMRAFKTLLSLRWKRKKR